MPTRQSDYPCTVPTSLTHLILVWSYFFKIVGDAGELGKTNICIWRQLPRRHSDVWQHHQRMGPIPHQPKVSIRDITLRLSGFIFFNYIEEKKRGHFAYFSAIGRTLKKSKSKACVSPFYYFTWNFQETFSLLLDEKCKINGSALFEVSWNQGAWCQLSFHLIMSYLANLLFLLFEQELQ